MTNCWITVVPYNLSYFYYLFLFIARNSCLLTLTVITLISGFLVSASRAHFHGHIAKTRTHQHPLHGAARLRIVSTLKKWFARWVHVWAFKNTVYWKKRQNIIDSSDQQWRHIWKYNAVEIRTPNCLLFIARAFRFWAGKLNYECVR